MFSLATRPDIEQEWDFLPCQSRPISALRSSDDGLMAHALNTGGTWWVNELINKTKGKR